jgi:hypothetical protein
MVCVPELRDDEEIFSLDEALIQGSLDTLSYFLLIAVIGSSIKESVTSLDGLR